MKKAYFFVAGWLGKIGIPIVYLSTVFAVIWMSLSLTEMVGHYGFYIGYALLILFLIILLIIPFKGFQFVVLDNNKIIAKNLIANIESIEWQDVVDYGTAKFGFIKWIYVSKTKLTEEEKLKMLAANRKNTFIRFVYAKKAYELITKHINRRNNRQQS